MSSEARRDVETKTAKQPPENNANKELAAALTDVSNRVPYINEIFVHVTRVRETCSVDLKEWKGAVAPDKLGTKLPFQLLVELRRVLIQSTSFEWQQALDVAIEYHETFTAVTKWKGCTTTDGTQTSVLPAGLIHNLGTRLLELAQDGALEWIVVLPDMESETSDRCIGVVFELDLFRIRRESRCALQSCRKKKTANMKQCSRCHNAVYCNQTCQQMDWKEHRRVLCCKQIHRASTTRQSVDAAWKIVAAIVPPHAVYNARDTKHVQTEALTNDPRFIEAVTRHHIKLLRRLTAPPQSTDGAFFS
jgi:hypothetical protein